MKNPTPKILLWGVFLSIGWLSLEPLDSPVHGGRVSVEVLDSTVHRGRVSVEVLNSLVHHARASLRGSRLSRPR